MAFPTVDPRQSFWALQQDILAYWKSESTFEKSIATRPATDPYRFYDGPPFITGTPHYGSLLSSIAKDVVGRYWTMRGKRVERVWGWDCHGLPIEQKVQAALGLESNRDIEEKVGVAKFVEECYKYTRAVSSEWGWYIDNIGRWVDLENAYKTMDQDYMESVMWVFKTLHEKGYVYEGKRVSLYSTKLSTPISNFEVAMDNSYGETNDPAITVKFPLEINGPKWANTFALAWTTTPWTMPAHMALAINKAIEYVGVLSAGEYYVVAKNRVEAVFHGKEYETVQNIPAEELIGLRYAPPYDFYKDRVTERDHRIYHADFITDTDGTGIGHEAPEFGDVDFELAKEAGITVTEALDEAGKYTREVPAYEGVFYRDANEPIMADLAARGLLFRKEGITHRVAFCPRSGTPLIHKAQKSWFIDIQSMKSKLVAENEKIYWFPEHLKHGRFEKGIESAPDWCVSRTRYWGAPMPVWRSKDGSETIVVGSRDEMMDLTRDEKPLTKLILVRHGCTDYNLKHHHDCAAPGKSRLTEEGIRQAQELVAKFADTRVDAIYSSPFTRCLDTISPLAASKGLEITKTAQLREIDKPSFQDRPCPLEDIAREDCPEGDETPRECAERMAAFYREILAKHAGQTVVVCSHGEPLVRLRQAIHGFDYATRREEFAQSNDPAKSVSKQAVVEYVFSEDGTPFDLHRPSIDRIRLKSPKTGEILARIPEVLDVWMDSGSMPYAQMHYPFENREAMEASFPADFIAEYVGQVRAWFYVMHVIGVSLFDSPAFTNVISTGVIYGNDGRKMSKSFKNYPDPRATIEKYGADAIRFYSLSSPLLSGGDINFSEEGILETTKRVILPLWNTYSFFTTYANIDRYAPSEKNMWFLRHGETEVNEAGMVSGGSNDSPLNARGREQAAEAAKRLANVAGKIDLIVASPLARTRETARIVADGIGYEGEVLIMDGLREQDYGEWQGKSFAEIKALHQERYGHVNNWTKLYRENETEPYDDFERRIMGVHARLLAEHPDKNILIVAHGGTLRAMRKNLFGLSREEGVYGQYGLGNCELVPLPPFAIVNDLDKWLITKSQRLAKTVDANMERYDIPTAARAIADFMDDLTNWYVRRSRRRFWRSESDADKAQAYYALHSTLVDLARVLAPFMPFIAESIYRGLTGRESVHLDYSVVSNNARTFAEIETAMDEARAIVTLGLSLRARKKLRVRQPLRSVTVPVELSVSALDIVREELNVKEVRYEAAEKIARKIGRPNARLLGAKLGGAVQEVIRLAKAGELVENADGTVSVGPYVLTTEECEIVYEPFGGEDNVQGGKGMVVAMDLEVDEELRREGTARDLVRVIQDMRKDAGYSVEDRILLSATGEGVETVFASFGALIAGETLATCVRSVEMPDLVREVEIESEKYSVSVRKA